MRVSTQLAFVFLTLVLTQTCAFSQDGTFQSRWEKFETKLIRKEKSKQTYKEFDWEKREGFEPVNYPSGQMRLKALINKGPQASGKKKPVLVYLHGGFALHLSELEITKKFTDAGFIVFAPSYRGENGNPGVFELFLGEVRDAKAAIDWISKQPYADANNIVVFGWSAGGGIALNLGLHDDLPTRMHGSSAGIYDVDDMRAWATEATFLRFPYDHTDKMENYFRLPVYLLGQLKKPHLAYVGTSDGYADERNLINKLHPGGLRSFRLMEVEGDHMTSVGSALDRFLEVSLDSAKCPICKS